MCHLVEDVETTNFEIAVCDATFSDQRNIADIRRLDFHISMRKSIRISAYQYQTVLAGRIS